MPRTRANALRIISAFESAHEDYVFRGTIPVGESPEATAAYEAVTTRYWRARERLLKYLTQESN